LYFVILNYDSTSYLIVRTLSYNIKEKKYYIIYKSDEGTGSSPCPSNPRGLRPLPPQSLTPCHPLPEEGGYAKGVKGGYIGGSYLAYD
jgi:hypothetical protein